VGSWAVAATTPSKEGLAGTRAGGIWNPLRGFGLMERGSLSCGRGGPVAVGALSMGYADAGQDEWLLAYRRSALGTVARIWLDTGESCGFYTGK